MKAIVFLYKASAKLSQMDAQLELYENILKGMTFPSFELRLKETHCTYNFCDSWQWKLALKSKQLKFKLKEKLKEIKRPKKKLNFPFKFAFNFYQRHI